MTTLAWVNVLKVILSETRRRRKIHLSLHGKASLSYLWLSCYTGLEIFCVSWNIIYRWKLIFCSFSFQQEKKKKQNQNTIETEYFLFISFSDQCQYRNPTDNFFFRDYMLALNEVEAKPFIGRKLKLIISSSVLSKKYLWVNLCASHIIH